MENAPVSNRSEGQNVTNVTGWISEIVDFAGVFIDFY